MEKFITVHDKMQQNYVYELVCPAGTNFADDFKPELPPYEMLQLGVFEGKYLNDCQDEFPSFWFEKAKLSPLQADSKLNLFHLKSRLSLQEWQKRGWIYGPDPRGWFQWYCRYYQGRRIPELDQLQIKRWKAFRRHKAQIVKNCHLYDMSCRMRQRQALLQWAYNPYF